MAKESLQSLGPAGRQLPGEGQVTYDVWRWTLEYYKAQVQLPQAVFTHIWDTVLWAWEKLKLDLNLQTVIQKSSRGLMVYADCIGHFTDSIEK